MRKHIGILLIAILLIFSVTTYGGEYNKVLTFENIFDSNSLTNSIRKEIDVNKLLSKDLSVVTKGDAPKILIIHSHATENYKDKGSVIDVGAKFKKELESNYKVSVIHDESVYDVVNGVHTPIGAYERMEKGVKEILKANPTIEVIIDIHRDGGAKSTSTLINGVPTARINLINGLSIDKNIGKLGSLETYPNNYIQENLALSVQMKNKSDALYPELVSKVKTKEMRYSLYMLPKSLLVEIGNNQDLVAEAINTVKPLTSSLAEVLKLEKIK